MSEINPLGASVYYGGVQNAASQAAKEQKKEKINSSGKIKFSDILKKSNESESELTTNGFPAEIANMSIEEAAVFLKDAVDIAGNKLSENLTSENVAEFRASVRQFIRYVTENNYEEHIKKRRGFAQPMQYFSNYNTKKRPKDPRVIIQTINTKLDEMVRETLRMQAQNLQILDKVNEIKGLIVDLMQA